MVPSKFCCLQHSTQSELLIENALIEITPPLVLCSRRKTKKRKDAGVSIVTENSLLLCSTSTLSFLRKAGGVWKQKFHFHSCLLFEMQEDIFQNKSHINFRFLQNAGAHPLAANSPPFSSFFKKHVDIDWQQTHLHFHLSSKCRCTLSGSKLTSTFIFLQKACGCLLALHSRYSTLERLVHLLLAVGVPAGTVVTFHSSCNRTNEHSV